MKPFIIIVFVILILTGCGTRMVYPNLDWLLPWYLNKYMALDGGQKSELKKTVSRHLNWHCGTQLDVYANFLRHLSDDMGDQYHPITHAKLTSRWETLRGFWKDLMVQISPDVSDLLLSLSDEQVEAMFERLEERNQELTDDYVDVDMNIRQDKRRKYMLKHMKRWISKLTAEQKQLVEDWSRRWQPTEIDWMAHRRDIQRRYRELFMHRSDEVYFRERIYDLLVYRHRYRSEAYRQKLEFNTDLTFALILDIDRSLSITQRQHLQKKLVSLARDFEQLSCDPRRKPPPVRKVNVSSLSP